MALAPLQRAARLAGPSWATALTGRPGRPVLGSPGRPSLRGRACCPACGHR